MNYSFTNTVNGARNNINYYKLGSTDDKYKILIKCDQERKAYWVNYNKR